MSEVVIFGTQDLAQLADYYLSHDSQHEVVAFTVHNEFIDRKDFMGKPVIPMENLIKDYPPDRVKLFAPMTHSKMNRLRESVYNEGKKKHYDFISYVSSKATVANNEIGENCFILEDNTLQPFTRIGNNVTLWCGNHIGHHGIIKDHVFFTSHVVLSGRCVIEPYSFFGVNSTIRDGSHIAQGTLVAMGASLVAQKTEEWGVYVGNPAKKLEGKLSHEI
jgi:sugar O-acyltransferase (sialic acid O-acetyltransferase NeuD family)